MRIAVASDGLLVSSGCKLCSNFTCYRIHRGIIADCQNMPNPRYSIERLAALLHELDVRVLIGGFIDHNETHAFERFNIEVVANIKGTAREAVETYLTQTLAGSLDSDEEHFSMI